MTNTTPDCTLVTSCFYTYHNNNCAYNIETIIEHSESLCKMPCYLVIYGDDITIPILKEMREKAGLIDLTKFITLKLSELWTYQFKDKVDSNRKIYWPSRDARAQTDSHLITSNKFDFVLKTIDLNPFNTSKFGWIDCFLRKNASKICENYSTDTLLSILNNITDKFHIQLLNVCDKKYKLQEFKKEYYEQYRWVVCGCFFTSGKEIGVKILTRLKEIFIETTELGYGHGEEMFYLEILDEYYNDICRGYGDYQQILNNLIEPTIHFEYIYHFILSRYLLFGYFKECYDCSTILLKQIESLKVSVSCDLYIKILLTYYTTCYYYKQDTCLEIENHIYDVLEKNPYLKLEFYKNHASYMYQFKFAKIFKEKYKLILCVFACATIPEYRNEILKIEETWGKRAEQKGVKVLYFLGEEKTDLADDSKYIYLKNVNNDYMSATDKQNLGLKYIHDNYCAEFIFCCGTDTYINIDNILLYVKGFDSSKPLYIGGHGDSRILNNESYYFHSGGPGFIITRACLKYIYSSLQNIKEDWIKVCNKSKNTDLIPGCDVALSYYLQTIIGDNLQIVKNNQQFFACNYKGLFKYKFCESFGCCNNIIQVKNIISCHCMTSVDFDEFTKILEDNSYFLENKTSMKNPFELDIEDKFHYTNDDLVEIQKKIENKREQVTDMIKSAYPYNDENYKFPLEALVDRCSKGVCQKLIDVDAGIYPSKILYKIGDGGDKKNCFVCCTTNLTNDRALRASQIHQSLEKVGFNGYFYLFNGGFPTPRGNEMKYLAVPYCFKIFMMLEAEKLGFEKIIWIDAGCYAVKNPQRLFDILNDDDAIFRQFWPYSPGIPTYENSVFKETINIINNITHGDLVNSINVCSVVFGVNMKSQKIQNFVNEYYEMVKLGTPFLSYFPEEVVISAIFNKPEYKYLFYNRDESLMLFIHENYMCNNFDIAKNNGYYFVQRQY